MNEFSHTAACLGATDATLSSPLSEGGAGNVSAPLALAAMAQGGDATAAEQRRCGEVGKLTRTMRGGDVLSKVAFSHHLHIICASSNSSRSSLAREPLQRLLQGKSLSARSLLLF